MQHSLLRALLSLRASPVLVLGDIMVDRYTSGNATRVSPEAPVLVMSADSQEVRLGGAAGVAALLHGLETPVELSGVVGEDITGATARRLIRELGISDGETLTDPGRVTTLKERFLARASQRHAQQVLRVDYEETSDLGRELESGLLVMIQQQLESVCVLLISDYAKGVCTPRILEESIAQAKAQGIPVIVDPARNRDFSHYRGASLIVPNRVEAELASGMKICDWDDATAAATRIRERFEFPAVLVKLDRDGMLLSQNGTTPFSISARAREVYDITGAGDMVLAVLGLTIGASWEYTHAATLANIAAGLEVEQIGVVPISRQQLADELVRPLRHRVRPALTLEEITDVFQHYRSQGKLVVLTCLDPERLDNSQIRWLLTAAERGDVLVVATPGSAPSASRAQQKTGDTCIDPSLAFAALRCIDHVVSLHDRSFEELVERVGPNVVLLTTPGFDGQLLARSATKSRLT